MANLITLNEEQNLELLDEEIGRKISVGSTWNSLRIGVRLYVDSTLTSYYMAPPFICGLCSGDTNMYHSDTTTHFVGLRTPTIDWTSYSTYGMLFDKSWTSGDNDLKIVKKINNTLTTFTTPSGRTFGAIKSDAPFPSCFALDIIKGDPNWTFNIYTSTPDTQRGYEDFIRLMHNPSVPTQYLAYKRTASVAAIDIDELTNGYLDTINLGWFSPLYKLYIADVAYSVFS